MARAVFGWSPPKRSCSCRPATARRNSSSASPCLQRKWEATCPSCKWISATSSARAWGIRAAFFSSSKAPRKSPERRRTVASCSSLSICCLASCLFSSSAACRIASSAREKSPAALRALPSAICHSTTSSGCMVLGRKVAFSCFARSRAPWMLAWACAKSPCSIRMLPRWKSKRATPSRSLPSRLSAMPRSIPRTRPSRTFLFRTLTPPTLSISFWMYSWSCGREQPALDIWMEHWTPADIMVSAFSGLSTKCLPSSKDLSSSKSTHIRVRASIRASQTRTWQVSSARSVSAKTSSLSTSSRRSPSCVMAKQQIQKEASSGKSRQACRRSTK
mmetsp:Transcript_93188/g.272757  ORF Transcript_93188/g.272757 Transcript_93188/m.272757 type:complete len:332 (-) Transcript_93188:94-1089(-)